MRRQQQRKGRECQVIMLSTYVPRRVEPDRPHHYAAYYVGLRGEADPPAVPATDPNLASTELSWGWYPC
jgi:hypothetical protein